MTHAKLKIFENLRIHWNQKIDDGQLSAVKLSFTELSQRAFGFNLSPSSGLESLLSYGTN